MLHAESLDLRRSKSDLTLIFRNFHVLSALDFVSFFTLCNSSTRAWASDEINETV